MTPVRNLFTSDEMFITKTKEIREKMKEMVAKKDSPHSGDTTLDNYTPNGEETDNSNDTDQTEPEENPNPPHPNSHPS